MTKRVIWVVVLWVVLLSLGYACAMRAMDGNELLKNCKAVAKLDNGPEAETIVNATYCLGFLEGVVTTHAIAVTPDLFCLPENSTWEQGARVAVKYMEANPEFLNKNGVYLIFAAFRKAWPCEAPKAGSGKKKDL